MRYRADVMFDSDMDEDDFAMWLEDVLYSISNSRAAVIDMTVHEVADLPSFAEMMRREHDRWRSDRRSPEDPT